MSQVARRAASGGAGGGTGGAGARGTRRRANRWPTGAGRGGARAGFGGHRWVRPLGILVWAKGSSHKTHPGGAGEASLAGARGCIGLGSGARRMAVAARRFSAGSSVGVDDVEECAKRDDAGGVKLGCVAHGAALYLWAVGSRARAQSLLLPL